MDNINFGGDDASKVDWRKKLADEQDEDNDQPMDETPEDVKGMLGFDPYELEEEDRPSLPPPPPFAE